MTRLYLTAHTRVHIQHNRCDTSVTAMLMDSEAEMQHPKRNMYTIQRTYIAQTETPDNSPEHLGDVTC